MQDVEMINGTEEEKEEFCHSVFFSYFFFFLVNDWIILSLQALKLQLVKYGHNLKVLPQK